MHTPIVYTNYKYIYIDILIQMKREICVEFALDLDIIHSFRVPNAQQISPFVEFRTSSCKPIYMCYCSHHIQYVIYVWDFHLFASISKCGSVYMYQFVFKCAEYNISCRRHTLYNRYTWPTLTPFRPYISLYYCDTQQQFPMNC